MPPVLSDPPSTLYIVLGTVVIVLGAIWLRTPSRGNLIRFAVAALVLLGLFATDSLVESPREQAVRKMKEMSAATQNHRMDDAFRHVSDNFQYNGMTKSALREKARWAEGVSNFQGVSVSGFERSDYKQIDDKTVQIGFEVWLTGFPMPDWRFYCLGTFKQDPDQEYRLSGLEFHKANEGAAGQVIIPPYMSY